MQKYLQKQISVNKFAAVFQPEWFFVANNQFFNNVQLKKTYRQTNKTGRNLFVGHMLWIELNIIMTFY